VGKSVYFSMKMMGCFLQLPHTSCSIWN